MKKFLLFLFVIFIAYLTAFYTAGKKNDYEDPFDFSYLEREEGFSFDFFSAAISEGFDHVEEITY